MKYSNHYKLKKLSGNTKNAIDDLEWSVGLEEIDDIFSAERCDLKSDLNGVLLNRMPRFLEKTEPLKSLSLATILEGQLVENRGVQRIVSKVNLEWIKARPVCFVGRSNFKKYVCKPPKRIVKTNKSIELCNKYFENELKIFFKNYCKTEGINDSIDLLIVNPCDIIVKSHLNNFKKKLSEHLKLSLRDIQMTGKQHKQHVVPLSNQINNSQLYNIETPKTRLPKISDSTSGMIKEAIGKENISAYNHLNFKYSRRIDDGIKEMNIEKELDNIVQEEFVVLNNKTESFDKYRQGFKNAKINVGTFDKSNKYTIESRLRDSQKELEEIVQVQLESIMDNEVGHLISSKRPCHLEQQFDAFTQELSMVVEDNNINTKNNTNVNGNYKLEHNEATRERSARKSLSVNYYDVSDEGEKMRAVYDKTISNDEDEVDYKINHNIFVADNERLIINDDGMGGRLNDFGEKEKRREYEEKKVKKKIHYREEYYRKGWEKGNGVVEVKNRKRKGVDDEKKKKKKEERKHKKKKRNRHKEKELKEDKEDSKPETIKSFEPEDKLYSDSSLSCCIDVFQFKSLSGHEGPLEVMQRAPSTKLLENFDCHFDISQAPSNLHDTPIMKMFLDASGAMDIVAETISHLKEFNIDVVDDNNAFLWSLVLTSSDPSQNEKLLNSDLDGTNTPQSQTTSKSTKKSSSNPLIQAFKQAVEANKNKQKDDKSGPTGKCPSDSKYLLMGNMGSGLSTLFRLQSNLKAGTRDMVRDTTDSFQKDLQKFFKKQTYLEDQEVTSSSISFEFSDSLEHFQDISTLTHKLYGEAEFKLSQRDKLLKYKQQYNKYGTYNLPEATDTVPTTEISTIPTTTIANFYQSTQPVISAPSQLNHPSTIVVTPSNTSTDSTSTTSISQPNYDYYSPYPPYPWTYMPPYNIPAYPHNYFQPIYPNYLPQNHLYPPPYNFPTNPPVSSYPPSTTVPTFTETTPSKQSRFWVFMVDCPETIAVEKYLEHTGLKHFDIHNISLLNYTANFEFKILIHQPLLPSIHHLPNLVNLKRDSRVIFEEFASIDDVVEKRFQSVFPRGGVVMLDLSTILSCKSDVLDSLCKHISNTNNTELSWSIITSAHAFKALQTLSNRLEEGNAEEHVRLTELTHILSTYQSQGLIQLMPNQSQLVSDQQSSQSKLSIDQSSDSSQIIIDSSTDLLTSDTTQPTESSQSETTQSTDPSTNQPTNQVVVESTSDYFNHFLKFQSTKCHSYRHFLFLTDLPRAHPDCQSFFSCGMEVFSMVDFMQAFVSKTVEHEVKSFEGFEARETPEHFIDAPLSLSSQTISFS